MLKERFGFGQAMKGKSVKQGGDEEATTSRKLLFLSYAGFFTIAIPAGALNVAWIHIEADFGLTLSALSVLLTTRSIAP